MNNFTKVCAEKFLRNEYVLRRGHRRLAAAAGAGLKPAPADSSMVLE
jgi:hypothetical protein